MTNKIYEYKDDQDWYVGSYSIFGGVNSLSDYQTDFPLFEFSKYLEMKSMVSRFQLLFYAMVLPTVCSPLW